MTGTKEIKVLIDAVKAVIKTTSKDIARHRVLDVTNIGMLNCALADMMSIETALQAQAEKDRVYDMMAEALESAEKCCEGRRGKYAIVNVRKALTEHEKLKETK